MCDNIFWSDEKCVYIQLYESLYLCIYTFTRVFKIIFSLCVIDYIQLKFAFVGS